MDAVLPMRRRRRRGLGLSLLLAVAALGAVAPVPAHAAVDLGAAVRTAKGVFPAVTQRCGVVGIEIGLLSVLNAGASAESYRIACRVRIAPATMATATQVQLCSLMVHEWVTWRGSSTPPIPTTS